MCSRLSVPLLLSLSLPPSLLALEEDTKSMDLRGYVFDQKGRYVNTASVYWYMIVYSLIITVILVAGCINLYCIRWHYRRKCRELIEILEAEYRAKAREEPEPSLFGLPVKGARAEDDLHQIPKGNLQPPPPQPQPGARLVWDPNTLAQLLHHMNPDRETAEFSQTLPYLGGGLASKEQPEVEEAPLAAAVGSTAGFTSGVHAASCTRL